MAGDYLLVAPIFTGEKTRKVILPKGKWYDFYTGAFVGDGEIIQVPQDYSQIPVFVKNGGIIPMMPPLLHAPAAGEKVDLEIRHYGDVANETNLYDDDGRTFDYEKCAFSWRLIKIMKQQNGKLSATISKPVSGKPSTIGKVNFVFMTH